MRLKNQRVLQKLMVWDNSIHFWEQTICIFLFKIRTKKATISIQPNYIPEIKMFTPWIVYHATGSMDSQKYKILIIFHFYPDSSNSNSSCLFIHSYFILGFITFFQTTNIARILTKLSLHSLLTLNVIFKH